MGEAAAPARTDRSHRYRYLATVAALLLITAAVLVAWGEILGYFFTDVDTLPLILTGKIDSWPALAAVLGQPLMQGRMVNARFYRPVTSLSYGLDLLLWGLDPAAFHRTDLLLHLANALALWVLLRLLWHGAAPPGQRRDGAAVALLAALLFAVHPLHHENVPAIARRPELLVALGLQLTLLFAWLRLTWRPAWQWLTGAGLLSCLLCLGAKESGFIIAGAVLLLGLCPPAPGRRQRLLRAIRVTVPYAVLSGLFLLARTWVLGGIGGYQLGQLSLARRALYSLLHHLLGLCLAGLSWLWAPIDETLQSLSGPRAWLLLVLAGLLLALLLRAGREIRWSGQTIALLGLLAGCPGLLFLVHLLSVLVPRYLYTTTLFFCALLAWGLVRGVRARGLTRPQGLLRLLAVAAAATLALSILLTSPLTSLGANPKWRISGEITHQTLTNTEALVQELPAGSTCFLVTYPYQIRTSYAVPLAPILLEHSVQAWLDLRLPERHLRVVGLSYLIIDGRGLPLAKLPPRVAMASGIDEEGVLSTWIAKNGIATRFPWQQRFGPRAEGQLYRFLGPLRGPRLRIALLDQAWASDPVFLVALPDRVELHRGRGWSTASGPLTAPVLEPLHH